VEGPAGTRVLGRFHIGGKAALIPPDVNVIVLTHSKELLVTAVEEDGKVGSRLWNWSTQ
jgi:hypothetical protein